MEYCIRNHNLNDQEINEMSKDGWIMFKAFDPIYSGCTQKYSIRIIWKKDSIQSKTNCSICNSTDDLIIICDDCIAKEYPAY